ncbi:hypothetical protein N0V90_004740 [Kalmusia sp. IMI 367209]|nr:hypothetical protein N0V90_004740 [Kalmusia sp. IMI 367209]
MSAPASRQQSPSEQPRRCLYRPSAARSTRIYASDASIALVGIRGTGLSTLAVMAASALGFRLLDADQQFYQATGLSRAKFKSVHGTLKYRHAEISSLRSMVLEHPTKAVIVCGPGAVETTGQALLSEYALAHPVIYVTRDVHDIQSHLRVYDAAKISTLLDLSAPTMRSLSNFEFHNLSYLDNPTLGDSHSSGSRSPQSLALKQVEHDFLRLVRSTTTKIYGESRNQQNRLLSTPVEARPFTYALVLCSPIPDIFWDSTRHVDILADVIELTIPYSEMRSKSSVFDNEDANFITRQFYLIRRHVQLPIILNIQLDEHNFPEALANIARYYDALHHGLRLAPDFLCVDLRCDHDMTRGLAAVKGTTKIIAQHHHASPSKSGWDTQGYAEEITLAEHLGADMVRLTQKATSVADNFAARFFSDQAAASNKHHIPIIAYNTGRLGKMSRYFNNVFSPVTDQSLLSVSIQDLDDALLTTQQSQRALYSSLLLDSLYFGIYGNNVSQSLSPAMHNAAFRISGMPHEYKIFQHPTVKDLEDLITDPDLGGLSITAPFKSDVISIVDYMSVEAQAIGAVNTLVPLRTADTRSLLDRNRAGPILAMYGDNTDWVGVRNCIRNNLSPINVIKRQTTALVIGAGGMARATTYALIRLGVRNIFIHNRTKQKAESLINHFRQRTLVDDGKDVRSHNPDSEFDNSSAALPKMRILEKKTDAWPDDADYPTIIVSCVATEIVDGKSSVDTSLSTEWLASPTGGVVMETPLLQQIQEISEQGWIAVDGLQMLPEQGKMQFELFTSRRAPIKLMCKEVVKAYTRKVAAQSD